MDTTLYTSEEIERHARVGFELASRRKMKLVSADKVNVMESGVLWRKVITEIGREFPDVELQHLYTDNCAYQLASNPRQFDVIVTDNFFGDILSDLAGALAGSLGMLHSASLNGLTVNAETRKPGIFEPVHGTAPDLAGQITVNPLAMILTIGMMYEYGFDLPGASLRLRRSVETALKQSIRTRDLGGEASTREMTDAVIEAWRQLCSFKTLSSKKTGFIFNGPTEFRMNSPRFGYSMPAVVKPAGFPSKGSGNSVSPIIPSDQNHSQWMCRMTHFRSTGV